MVYRLIKSDKHLIKLFFFFRKIQTQHYLQRAKRKPKKNEQYDSGCPARRKFDSLISQMTLTHVQISRKRGNLLTETQQDQFCEKCSFSLILFS